MNLQSTASTTQPWWSFDLRADSPTGASIRDGASMTVAGLGTMFSAQGCAKLAWLALAEIESGPGPYRVRVDTTNHQGDPRGTLSAGMGHDVAQLEGSTV